MGGHLMSGRYRLPFVSDLILIVFYGQTQKNRQVVTRIQESLCRDVAQKIMIKKEGSLVGNIKTTGIVIDDDAYFKGSIDIVRNPPAKAQTA